MSGDPGSDPTVRPRPTRPVLILHARPQPQGGQAVNLAEVLTTLRRDPATKARAIGPEADPEAVAATLTDDQIEDVVRTLGDSVRLIDDTELGF